LMLLSLKFKKSGAFNGLYCRKLSFQIC
jgi:hypothetical protein